MKKPNKLNASKTRWDRRTGHVGKTPQELDEIVELAMDITANRHRTLHQLYVPLLDDNRPHLIAKRFHLRLLQWLALHQMLNLTVQIRMRRHRFVSFSVGQSLSLSPSGQICTAEIADFTDQNQINTAKVTPISKIQRFSSIENVFGFCFLFIYLFFKFLGLCSWIWICVLVVLVQGTFRSQFIWFLVFNFVFNFFYQVKINKLIFFNLDADVAFFNVKKHFLLLI